MRATLKSSNDAWHRKKQAAGASSFTIDFMNLELERPTSEISLHDLKKKSSRRAFSERQ